MKSLHLEAMSGLKEVSDRFSSASGGLRADPGTRILNLDFAATNARLSAFAAHCREHGIIIEHHERSSWRVIEPEVAKHQLQFEIGAFPESATLSEMQNSLFHISAALALNSDARIAMSFPAPLPTVSDRGDINHEQQYRIMMSPEYKNLVSRLVDLFLDYAPELRRPCEWRRWPEGALHTYVK